MNKTFNNISILIIQFVVVLLLCFGMSQGLESAPQFQFYLLRYSNLYILELVIQLSIHMGLILLFAFLSMLSCALFYKSTKKNSDLNIFTIILSILPPFVSLITVVDEMKIYYIGGIAIYCIIMITFFSVLIKKNPAVMKKKIRGNKQG